MSSLIEKLKLGTDNTKLIKWPGSDTQVALRIISEQARMEASFATERLFKSEKIENNLMTADQYDTEKVIQILFRALRCPDDLDKPVFPSITEFRKALTREDMRLLIAEYTGFENECSPSPENLSDEDFDKIFREVKKNAATTTSNIGSMSTLRRLIITLVDQPVSSLKDNG